MSKAMRGMESGVFMNVCLMHGVDAPCQKCRALPYPRSGCCETQSVARS